MIYSEAAPIYVEALTNYYFRDPDKDLDVQSVRLMLESESGIIELGSRINTLFQMAVYDPMTVLHYRDKIVKYYDVLNIALLSMFLRSPGLFANLAHKDDLESLLNPTEIQCISNLILVSDEVHSCIRSEIMGVTQNLKQWI